MSRRYALVAVCACLATGSAATAQAAPTWLPVQSISAPASTTFGIYPLVTMGPNGAIVATWTDHLGVHVSVRDAGTEGYSEELISIPGQEAAWPSVAINASGTIAVAWINGTKSQYEVSVRPPHGAFSTPVEAGPTGGGGQQKTSVAIDAAGDLLLGEDDWTSGRLTSYYAFKTAGASSFIRPQISEAGREGYMPMVALDQAGDAVLAWEEQLGSGLFIARAMTRPAAGAFGAAQSLTSESEYAGWVQAAIGQDGRAAVIWQRTPKVASPFRIEASTSEGPGLPLGPAQTISPSGGSDEWPAIAVAGDGEALAAWEQTGTTASDDLAAAPAGASFGTPVEISANGSPGDPSVAADGAGDATISWGAQPSGIEGMDVVTRSAAGALTPEVTLSGAGEKLSFFFSNVQAATAGMDTAGDAVVGWEQASERTIGVRIYNAPRPALTPEAPASTPIASPTICPAGATLIAGACVTSHPRCSVPRLAGLSAVLARRRLLLADCKLGKTLIAKRYRHVRHLMVAAQSVKPGSALAYGASVSITLRPASARHRGRHHR